MQPFNRINVFKKKAIMKNRILTLVLITFFAVSSAMAQNVETRKLSNFSAIDVGEAIDVFLIPGNSESAKIEVKGADPENILTEISGKRLKIHMERGNWRNVSAKVYLTYVEIDNIEISSAASVYTDGVLKTDKLYVDVSSAGDGELEIDVNSIEVDVSSAGDLNVSGKTDELYVDVSSSGDYNGYDLEADEVEAYASSAGSASVTANVKINAKASSAGSIRYRGNPEKEYVSSGSGGSVRKN